MTTKELRDALDKLMAEHPDAAGLEVITEGCDCDGDVKLARYEPEETCVYPSGKTHKWDAYVYLARSEAR